MMNSCNSIVMGYCWFVGVSLMLVDFPVVWCSVGYGYLEKLLFGFVGVLVTSPVLWMIGPCSYLMNLGVRFTKISVQRCFSSLFWLSRELSIEGCCDHLVNFGLIVFWVGVFRWCRCEIDPCVSCYGCWVLVILFWWVLAELSCGFYTL
jgi:hypothetical protein